MLLSHNAAASWVDYILLMQVHHLCSAPDQFFRLAFGSDSHPRVSASFRSFLREANEAIYHTDSLPRLFARKLWHWFCHSRCQ